MTKYFTAVKPGKNALGEDVLNIGVFLEEDRDEVLAGGWYIGPEKVMPNGD